MLKVGILASAALGLKALKSLHDNDEIELSCVFTDYKSLDIIEYCYKHELNIFKGNPRNNEAYEFIKSIGEIDLLFSINYIFIIEKELFEYPNLFSLNIHGSLLPKYRGRTPHVWSIINGEEKIGITVHRIDSGVDTGDILLQKEIEITKNNTGADILNKYSTLYPIIINDTIDIILNRIVVFKEQDEKKATYFGKRTPKDGLINWNMNKEFIGNWVRAQAKPYPGAFTYLKNKKMVINSVGFSDIGYSYDMENGKVLSVSPLIIKTPNGALELLDYSIIDNENLIINKTDILGK